MFKPLLFTAAFSFSLTLIGCKGQIQGSSEPAPPAQSQSQWPSLSKRINCLPEQGVLIAAHRGVSRGKGLAENTVESLKALYAGGIRIAEIDVAQLSSGEHVLFHDGVWEDKSTGQGAVARSQWRDVQNYLLSDTEGRVSSVRPSLLKDALEYSKGRLHLEIDFKSSADYGEVIDMIRTANMSGDVLLIAYNEKQARAMAKLAPDMSISVSINQAEDVASLERMGVKRSQMMAWVGRSENRKLMKTLSSQGIEVLTYESGRRRPYLEADVFVTDRALDKNVYEGAMGLSSAQVKTYADCLEQ